MSYSDGIMARLSQFQSDLYNNLRKSFEQRACVSDAADGRLVFDLVCDVADSHFLEPAARRLLVEVGLVLSPTEPDEGEVALFDAGVNA